jgi:spore coat polysaccharide biosynthesis protein SpsF (cytidylyltransferase family)
MTTRRLGIVVAARTASSRLPGKALLPLGGVPIVIFLLRRLRGLASGRVIFATSDLCQDDALAAIVTQEGVPVYRGSHDDVVARYVGVAKQYGLEIVGRITGDCPFVNAELIDWCVGQTEGFGDYDLATTKQHFPVGLDLELYSADRMTALHVDDALSAEEREHLTLHFYNHRESFRLRSIAPPSNWPRCNRSFTVDTAADYAAASDLVGALGRNDFSIPDLLQVAA